MDKIKMAEKAKQLELIDNLITKQNDSNKKTAIKKIKIRGLYLNYLEVAIYFDKDYEIYKKATTEDFIDMISKGKIYIMNPGFLNRYFKQKWYREIRNLI